MENNAVKYMQNFIKGQLEDAEATTYTHDEIEEYIGEELEQGQLKDVFNLGDSDCLVHVVVSDLPEYETKYFLVFERLTDNKILGYAVQNADSGETVSVHIEQDN